jgi:glyceraldehyde 3-phosphate dehydrogenase
LKFVVATYLLILLGRVVFRASLIRDDIIVVAINHTCASVDDVIHQMCYDSTHGPLTRTTGSKSTDIYAIDEQTLSVRGNTVHLFSERDPAKINWDRAGADYIVESTGKFTTCAAASAHIEHGGAKKVLISAPSKDSPTFVYGVNAHNYSSERPDVISCASCTTNCLAPIAKVLNDKFGITQALMTTVHASTRSQHVLDGYSKRDRRAGNVSSKDGLKVGFHD